MGNNYSLSEDYTLHNSLKFDGIEAYKQIRANLSFIIPEDEEKKCRVLGVTSSVRGEGKSTTSINLAYVIAQAGHRVLLIDGDMRLPSIGKKLNIETEHGLSNILSARETANINIVRAPVCEKWDVMTAGDVPPNPSELISSQRFKRIIDVVSEHYEYCIIDLPPVNVVSDAIEASHSIDGLIVVVRENYTEREELAECMRKLDTVKAHILGIIANDVQSNEAKYKYYKKKKGKYYKKYQKYKNEE